MAMKESPEIVEKWLERGLEAAAIEVEARGRKKTPRDTSRLASSISHRVSKLRAIVGTNVKYAVFVHEGTRPHFPPPKALAGWARRHGMAGKEFLIARAISRRGTKARPFLKEGLAESKRKIDSYLNDALAGAVQEIANKTK